MLAVLAFDTEGGVMETEWEVLVVVVVVVLMLEGATVTVSTEDIRMLIAVVVVVVLFCLGAADEIRLLRLLVTVGGKIQRYSCCCGGDGGADNGVSPPSHQLKSMHDQWISVPRISSNPANRRWYRLRLSVCQLA